MPWYDGPSLLHHLEHVHIASDRNLIDVRFPVQYVIRPHAATDAELHDYRGYAGQVAGGVLKPGDEVLHLPSGFSTRVRRIEAAGTEIAEAFAPMSVTLLLDDDVDISRGDMICRPNNRPAAAQDIEAMVCWMSSDQALARRSRLVVKHTSRTVKAIVTDLHYRIDVNTLHRDEAAGQLGLNEIGRVGAPGGEQQRPVRQEARAALALRGPGQPPGRAALRVDPPDAGQVLLLVGAQGLHRRRQPGPVGGQPQRRHPRQRHEVAQLVKWGRASAHNRSRSGRSVRSIGRNPEHTPPNRRDPWPRGQACSTG